MHFSVSLLSHQNRPFKPRRRDPKLSVLAPISALKPAKDKLWSPPLRRRRYKVLCRTRSARTRIYCHGWPPALTSMLEPESKAAEIAPAA